jgi:uncharacterized protein (TIGR00730 family)
VNLSAPGNAVITRKNNPMQSNSRIKVAVFCGSKHGNNPIFSADAAKLGELLGKGGFDIVYGGSHKGIMGDIANNALANGSAVTGILPRVLLEWEHQHNGLTELIITENMHERKRTMYELGMAGIVLPGGFGTLDEMFEMLTWNQLSIHDKKIHILNSGGFYNHLIAHLEYLQDSGFLYDPIWKRITKHENPDSLVNALITDFN